MSAGNQQGRTKKEIGDFIAGFVDGEGSFSITIQRSKNVRLGIQVIPEFHVCQHSDRTKVLKIIKVTLKCGYIKPNHAKNPHDLTWVFVVRDLKNLRDKIVPFFQQFSLIGKQQDFKKFTKVIKMMDDKLHLTRKGLKQILRIAFSMNSGGKYRKLSLQEIFSSL